MQNQVSCEQVNAFVAALSAYGWTGMLSFRAVLLQSRAGRFVGIRRRISRSVHHLDRAVFLQDALDLARVADGDHLHRRGIDIFLRHALNILRRDRGNLSGIFVPVIGGKAVRLRA